MSTQTLRKRSITPEPHTRDDSTENATIQRRTQQIHLLPRHLYSLAAGGTFPILAGLLLTCAPTGYLYSVERSRSFQQRTDPRILVGTYVLTGTVGMAVAMLVQSVLSYVLAFVCFNGHANAVLYLAETMKTEHDISDEAHRKRRREMSRRRRYWVFMLLFCFVAAGLVEESIKYIVVTAMLARAQRSSHRPQSFTTGHDYITVAVSAALGFATVENIAFISAEARRPKGSCRGGGDAAPKDSQQDGRFALLTAVERVLLGIPGHAMTAALIGANMLIRDHGHDTTTTTSMSSAWLILRDSVLFHGCFNSVLLALSACEGNVGWVHPRRPLTVCVGLALAVGQQAALALMLRARLCRAGLW